jgi:uncharacterized protein YkvS
MRCNSSNCGGKNMTLKELKERALVSADEIGNEIEYADQLIEAINKVQNKLVVFAKNIYKYEYVLSRKARTRGNHSIDKITLPEDCYELVEVRDEYLNLVKYSKVNNKEVQTPKDGLYQIKYKAFLPNITKDTPDDYEIQIEPIAEACMVAGVASWIAIDNPEIYDVLNNEYNNLLANLSQMPETVGETSNGIERIGGWYW